MDTPPRPAGVPLRSDESVVVEIPLHTPANHWIPWPLAIVGAVAAAAGVAFLWFQPVDDGLSTAVLLLAAFAYLTFVGQRGLRWRSFRPRLVLTTRAIISPKSPTTPSWTRIAFADVVALSGHAASSARVLVIASAAKRAILTSSQIGSAKALATVEGFVRTRIAELPGGHESLADFANQARVSMRTATGRAWVTHAALGIMVLVFWVEWSADALSTTLSFTALQQQIRLGANSPQLVADGQWWRLASATFLHGSSTHLLVNGFALYQLGGLLERLLGWQRYSLVFIVGALAGSAASAWMQRPTPSVGASTALFGLLGALVWTQITQRRSFPAMYRQTAFWWVVIGGLNGGLSYLFPAIDGAAHVGGFVGGLLGAALVLWGPNALGQAKPRTWLQFAAVGCLGAFLAAGAVAVDYARNDHDRSGVELLERLTKRDPSAETLNLYAWNVAIDPDAADSALEYSARLSARACQREPSWSYLDTHATLLHRLGQLAEATALEAQVLEANGDSFSGGQLLRFAAAMEGSPECVPVQAVAATGESDWPMLSVPPLPLGSGQSAIGVAWVRVGDRTDGVALWRGEGELQGEAQDPFEPRVGRVVQPLCWFAIADSELPLPVSDVSDPLATSLPSAAPAAGHYRVYPVSDEPLHFPTYERGPTL